MRIRIVVGTDIQPQKKLYFGYESWVTPRPRPNPKTKIKINLLPMKEFNSTHFGMEINKRFKFLTHKMFGSKISAL